MTGTELAARIEEDLRRHGSPDRAERERTYLKSALDHLGVPVPPIRRVVKAVDRAHPPPGHDCLTDAVRALWDRGIHECRMAAVELLALHPEMLGPGDLVLAEHLLRTSRTWALVDPLAIDVAGGIVGRHPEASARLDVWAADEDFWMRRASLLALLRPLRQGHGDFDRFARYAEPMLPDGEFFVRKAIGWVLRETGRRRPDLVLGWLEPRIHRVSGVTVREAVKPLDDADRRRLLAARSGSRRS